LRRRLSVWRSAQLRRYWPCCEALSSPAAVLTLLDTKPEDYGWPEYHAAIALGLSGRSEEARHRFLYLADPGDDDDREWVREKRERCRQFADLVTDARRFADIITDLIREHRAKLRLPVLADPLYGK
jgi:hypothetical protein